MLRKSSFLKAITSRFSPISPSVASFSCLRVKRRSDKKLDQAIAKEQEWRTCLRVVREILIKPSQRYPYRYLTRHRKSMGLSIPLHTFISRYPGLLQFYMDRTNPLAPLERFIRPGPKLAAFLQTRDSVYNSNEGLIVSKLCKLLMLSRNKVLTCQKLLEVKREFGFPDHFMLDLVPRYPQYFRFIPGEGKGDSYLGLVNWNEEFGKSVIELRAEEESRSIGIRVRPAFDWKLPPRFLYKKAMMEWVREWMEMPYVSPYAEEGWKLDPASREAEKRMIGVFHELLSLSLYKRMTVDVLGKFCEDYNYSNAFTKAFTRHQGLFYVSLEGGTRTIFLREAYEGGELIDRADPLLQINDKFIELAMDAAKQFAETRELKRQMLEKKREEEEAAREPEIVFFDSD